MADPLSRFPSSRHASERTMSAARSARQQIPRGKGDSTDLSLTSFEDSCVKLYSQDPCSSDSDNLEDLTSERDIYFKGMFSSALSGRCAFSRLISPLSRVTVGTARTMKVVSELFWWPGLYLSVADFVKHCTHFQVNKSRWANAWGSSAVPSGSVQALAVFKHGPYCLLTQEK